MANYKEYNQNQMYFIPLDQDINFPEGSYVRFLNNFVDNNFDIKPFEQKRKNDKGGAPAKHALMMLKIIFYAFSKGIYSMRELAGEYLLKHVDYIYLSANQTVHHSTLSRFINYYSDEIIQIFAQILYVANNLSYVSKQLVAIDGVKIKADASKKFTGSYESFLKRKETYEKMIENLLDRAKLLEDDEDNKDEKRKIKRLEKDYNNSLSKINDFINNCKNKGLKKQINLTDPDSNLMEKNNHYFQGYNCQVGVNENGIILTNEVTNIATDRNNSRMMVKSIHDKLEDIGLCENDIKGKVFLMDKGYQDSKSLGSLVRDNYNIYIPFMDYGNADKCKQIRSHQCRLSKLGKICILECPGGQLLKKDHANKDGKNWYYIFYTKKEKCTGCTSYNKCAGLLKDKKVFRVKREIFDNLEELNELRAKMKDKKEKHTYDKRMGIVEPVFGTLRYYRNFKSFLVRGIDKVKLQWSMVCSGFNLKKLYVLDNM